jgi:hypothetical protein
MVVSPDASDAWTEHMHRQRGHIRASAESGPVQQRGFGRRLLGVPSCSEGGWSAGGDTRHLIGS